MLSVKTFIFNELQENTYIVYNETKECVIIDAGNHHKFEDKALIGFIDENGLKPKMLLNTHSHIDHVMGNAVIADRYGIPLAAGIFERKYYEKIWIYAAAFGIDFDQDKCVMPSINLADGDVVKIGDDTLKVLYTPGHAPGHICFYDEKDGIVFTGDTLFYRGIGRCDLLGGSYTQITDSLKKVLYKLPDDTVVYSGHGPVTRIGDEKRNNPEVTED